MTEKKGKVDSFMYDVFISHKSDCKPWVEILAQNLKNNGFTIFLDEWELVPGKSITEGLYNGLRNSRKGILVVTPEVIESGWVREEYNQMMVQKQENHGFSIIPVVLGQEVPDFPFMKDILWVDFRDPNKYRDSFYRLVCAINEIPPVPHIDLKREPVIPQERTKETLPPGKDEISFTEELFELYFTKQAVVLLAQADSWQGGVKTRILERAKNQYGETNVLHLVPPFGGNVNMKDYFSLLGKQCGFTKDTVGSVSFGSALEDR